MAKQKRPTIKKGPATQYALPGELVMEFSDGKSGGLIALRRDSEDRLELFVYQQDADVDVVVGTPRGQ